MRTALATINARYAHSALALRYLKANLGTLQEQARIFEFVTGARTETMAEELLEYSPAVIALSVYIWNVEELTRLAGLLKTLAPEIILVIGGPEVSHETEQQTIFGLCDYVITGAAEHAFARLCAQLQGGKRPLLKKIVGDSLLTEGLVLPYELYSDEDIRNRFIYLEASRGCPFKCEFCLSALDKTAVPFQMDLFLVELTKLFQRGARTFKFIDRTFNLRLDDCERLLRFFLECIEQQQDPDLLLHFELIPDHLPDRLRGLIARFPRGTLQFEIGIQTWNPEVQARISRRQNNEKSEANLIWLREFSHAHLHVDLIAGLPGETLESFATGFDRLVQLRPHEIQVGILKRLRGTPIIRHTAQFDLRFNPNPPYNLVASTLVPFAEMQKLQRFARYWDLIGNSGGYARTLPWLLGTTPGSGRRQVEARISPFARFAALSQWIYSRTDSTYQFSPQRLFTLIKTWIEETIPDSQEALQALEIDYTTRLSRRRPNKADASVGASTGKPANEPSESNKLAGKTPIRLRHQRLVTPPEEGVHLRP